MYRSLGVLEVTGMSTMIACLDAMEKSAFINIHAVKRTGSGMLTILIKGDLASIQAALEIGADIAQSFGGLVAVKAIARPYSGLELLTGPAREGVKDGES